MTTDGSDSTSSTTKKPRTVGERSEEDPGPSLIEMTLRDGRQISLSLTSLTSSKGQVGLGLSLPGEWLVACVGTDESPYDPNFPIDRTFIFLRELRTRRVG